MAPAASGLHSIIPPRNVGGNMDVLDIAEGTELWLPVEVAGALFSVGDTHAAQGDGRGLRHGDRKPDRCRPEVRPGEGRQPQMPRYVTPGPVTSHFDKRGYEVTTASAPT